MDQDSKKCTKCLEVKPLEAFTKQPRGKLGRKAECKSCKSKYDKDRYDPEKSAKLGAVWRASRPEYHKEYYQATKEVRKKKNKEYYKVYYSNNRLKSIDKAKRRRALKRSVSTEYVELIKVFQRDGWICQLCLEPVDPNISYPDPRSKSLDHTVPLAKGGSHCYDNVQLAHLECNLSKGDKISTYRRL